MANEGVTSPKGFLAAGVSCGLKQSGNRDLGLIVCPGGAKAAALFTTNSIVAAPVTVSREHVKSRNIYAVIVNSGNANACTGKAGIRNAEKMCALVADGVECGPEEVLVASTGIIGHPLEVSKIEKAIGGAFEKLDVSEEASLSFAKSIMTTDTKLKQALRKLAISGRDVIIAGTAKGAGMIGPNMATTLSFITTDAAISKTLLARAQRAGVGSSFNKLTVDIHQSTNDTSIILASGAAGNKAITKADSDYRKFEAAVVEVCDDLARQMALDAEGATRMFKVVVNGAASKADASKAARAVADSPLVKCAVHGGDPNWGRIICAVGSCGVKLNESKLSCKIEDITVFSKGSVSKFDASKAAAAISKVCHTITVSLGVGKVSDFCYGCDLSREYVAINADYHT